MADLLSAGTARVVSGSLQRFLTPESWAELSETGMGVASPTLPWDSSLCFVLMADLPRYLDARLICMSQPPEYAGDFALLVSAPSEPELTIPLPEHHDTVHQVRSERQRLPMLMYLDTNGVILNLNSVAEDVTGLPENALVGREFWTLPIWQDATQFEIDSRDGLQSALDGNVERCLSRLSNAWQNQIWMELSFSGADEAGAHAGKVLVEGQDVTSRIEAEISKRQYTERLGHLSRKLLSAQENERRRIAQELHDEIGQSLTALRLSLHTIRKSMSDRGPADRLGACMLVVDQVLLQIRNLSLDLWPTMLDDLGLEAALGWFIARQAELTGLDMTIDSQLNGRRWSRHLEVACFRIAQEAISNAMRHSKSQQISVRVVMEDESWLVLSVQDFGRGFSAKQALDAATEGRSIGLVSMQERTALLNGEFTVQSAPNRGSKIIVRFPVGLDREHEA